jgi:hypothetical protein
LFAQRQLKKKIITQNRLRNETAFSIENSVLYVVFINLPYYEQIFENSTGVNQEETKKTYLGILFVY